MRNRSCLLLLLVTLLLAGGVIYGVTRWVWSTLVHHSEIGGAIDRWEQTLGESIWEDIQHTQQPIHDQAAMKALDRLLFRICAANGIDTTNLRWHLVQNPEVNAFALPGRRLVVQSGLIHNAQGADEVAGVLAHELAHVQKGHVRRKILKEAGLSLLMTWISGGIGIGNSKFHELAMVLSSTAFDRKYESEADGVAVMYLQKAGIHPGGLASFMDRLASSEKTNPAAPEWFSTHPASPKRAARIRQLEHNPNRRIPYTSSLDSSDWKALKQASQPQSL